MSNVMSCASLQLQKFEFVLGDYKQECWYWEGVELGRKLLLTGLIGLVQRGSIAQTVLAALISFGFFAATLKAQPFKSERLNLVKLVSEFQLYVQCLLLCPIEVKKANH